MNYGTHGVAGVALEGKWLHTDIHTHPHFRDVHHVTSVKSCWEWGGYLIGVSCSQPTRTLLVWGLYCLVQSDTTFQMD